MQTIRSSGQDACRGHSHESAFSTKLKKEKQDANFHASIYPDYYNNWGNPDEKNLALVCRVIASLVHRNTQQRVTKVKLQLVGAI